MAKKIVSFKTKGMNRDLSVSAFNPEFSFENRNLRLSTNEGNTMMSWVNEKGTAKLSCNILTNPWVESTSEHSCEDVIHGNPIGTAVINSTLILFTTGDYDYIYILTYGNKSFEGKLLYKGHLNFSTDNPLETMVSYESSKVQKVYWTDNRNQPRLINIGADSSKIKKWNHNGTPIEGVDTFFNFVPDLQLKETIKVKKLLGVNGSFAPGVIQYAFTYYNKYGQESNIFYTTPLYYISYMDRGASPDDTSVENAFQITVNNVDHNFDYLRIYSIQRTSINGTPIAKRIQDIQLVDEDNDVSFTDTGTTGNNVDPTELLYKGGENIIANTFSQKDNTLFFGNIQTLRPYIEEFKSNKDLLDSVHVYSSKRDIYPLSVSTKNYIYYNQLTSYDSKAKDNTVPCTGFKHGDVYRLGIQFQYKSGKWSNPIRISDLEESYFPTVNGNKITLPIFKGKVTEGYAKKLKEKGYRKVRGVLVLPKMQDRRVLCQGVVCPTLFTSKQRNDDKNLQAQSSWFFRTKKSASVNGVGAVYPSGGQASEKGFSSYLPYTWRADTYNPNKSNYNIKTVEVQGDFESENRFQTRYDILTMHSPDIEFEDYLTLSDFFDAKYIQVGSSTATNTFSDIDIQTESPTISNNGSGFIHKSFIADSMYGISSGLFYDDYIVDDQSNNTIGKYAKQRSSCKWMVYLWNKNGSLNNDITRPSNMGTPSAILKKKIVSNLRFCSSTQYKDVAYDDVNEKDFSSYPQIFSSDQSTILKLGDDIYMGNIDTLLSPDNTEGMYFAFGGTGIFGNDSDKYYKVEEPDINTPFTAGINWKTWSTNPDTSQNPGIWHRGNGTNDKWQYISKVSGDYYVELALKKEGVRMKYKSTPHMVFNIGTDSNLTWEGNSFPVVEVIRDINNNTIFGGTSQDALMENNWIPCGIPVSLDDIQYDENKVGFVYFDYSFGDTYYQRWDCLKTYPFTNEDVNQVVEIGSFMLETHVNIDGRYDRNRGQISNINMSPRNFNLLNPIYSQTDNFFTYKILDKDSYENTKYSNQITWSLTKTNGADVDLWTNITLANTMELDGDKGSINRLIRFNDQLLAFQDTGISQILYNENVQVSSTQGVPIEIANSGKVQGNRYISNSIGCSDKWALTVSPLGVYFIDNYDKGIYLFNGQLQNLSLTKGFNSWIKQNAKNPSYRWTPVNSGLGFMNFVAYYDRTNQDILFIDKNTALAYSERAGAFTSFYDYGGTPYFVNVGDIGVWIKSDEDNTVIYGHNMGNYCDFFDNVKPYWITLIANPEPQTSKVFTNVELRATVDGDGTNDEIKNIFTPLLPFDNIEVWNEYQHGIQSLANKTGKSYMQHYTKDEASTLKRKFRIWRADIPRDNAPLTSDKGLNISRLKPKSLDRIFDRIRNPWIYLKLEKDNPLNRTEIHDIVLTYFN